MKRALAAVAGGLVGYAVGVAIVMAATVWGHVVHFQGFGLLRGAVVAVSLAAVGAFLGFIAVYRRDVMDRVTTSTSKTT
jgi:uncharacterized membrane protein YjfL (UPF0719 family)